MSHFPFTFQHYDLVSSDGIITHLTPRENNTVEARVAFEDIAPTFLGFKIDRNLLNFNLKSTLAQLGLEAIGKHYELDPKLRIATAVINLIPINLLGAELLKLLQVGAYVGKLFAADDRRRVRDPEYLSRMFSRSDRHGKPLLSLGGFPGDGGLVLEKIDGRTVAFISLKQGIVDYHSTIIGFLPTIAKALCHKDYALRDFLGLHQYMKTEDRFVHKDEMLLVKTEPLHIRTVFGHVINELLPKGYRHTSASLLQPDTQASGNIYELYGSSETEISDIPLEFYTLEPYREYVFFQDRDQLQHSLEHAEVLFKAFESAPKPDNHKCATYIVKGDQLLNLKDTDWIKEDAPVSEFPGIFHPERQATMVEKYIQKQPSYPFLKALEEGDITSQGILLSRFFPSPLMKRLLLSEIVQKFLKGIYFECPSRSNGEFFSHEDRSLLLDLAKFGIPVYWVDKRTKTVLQYVPKADKDSGMFVPLKAVEIFYEATAVGIYGSNLIEVDLEEEFYDVLKGLLELKNQVDHPLLNPKTNLILVTGGGPGVMMIANRAAKRLGVLSCANIVDFSSPHIRQVKEQEQNPYVEAKMTYKLERLIERQAEFNLNLPIFVLGGIGTDFEYSLEEIRRKLSVIEPTPVLLFGPPDYWKMKITHRYKCNVLSGTIRDSEWISNCFYCVQTAKQALEVYHDYFSRKLPIGPTGPVYEDGFKIIE